MPSQVLGTSDLSRRKIFRIGRYARKKFYALWDYSRLPYLKARIDASGQPDAVFIWIPKTAGTSMWTALGFPKFKSISSVRYRFPNKGLATFGHMDYRGLVEQGYIAKKYDDSAAKFAFVRNPYARAVSLFFFLKNKSGRVMPHESFLDFCRRLDEEGCPPIGLHHVLGLSQCNPQARWIENLELDFLGRVETIEKDWNSMSEKLGLETSPLQRLNESAHSSYQDYYCRETKQIVEHFYRDDFRLLGYEHEDFIA